MLTPISVGATRRIIPRKPLLQTAATVSNSPACEFTELSVAAIPTPIRIARIVTRFGVGGVERHVSTLTANLNHEKFRSWLICGRAEKNERECLEFARDAGVQPVFIESLGRNMARLNFGANGQRPKLIHTFHGHQFDGYFKRPVARAFILIERLLARL